MLRYATKLIIDFLDGMAAFGHSGAPKVLAAVVDIVAAQWAEAWAPDSLYGDIATVLRAPPGGAGEAADRLLTAAGIIEAGAPVSTGAPTLRWRLYSAAERRALAGHDRASAAQLKLTFLRGALRPVLLHMFTFQSHRYGNGRGSRKTERVPYDLVLLHATGLQAAGRSQIEAFLRWLRDETIQAAVCELRGERYPPRTGQYAARLPVRSEARDKLESLLDRHPLRMVREAELVPKCIEWFRNGHTTDAERRLLDAWAESPLEPLARAAQRAGMHRNTAYTLLKRVVKRRTQTRAM